MEARRKALSLLAARKYGQESTRKVEGLAVTALCCKLHPERMKMGSGLWTRILKAQGLLSYSLYRHLKEATSQVCANQSWGSPIRVKMDGWQRESLSALIRLPFPLVPWWQRWDPVPWVLASSNSSSLPPLTHRLCSHQLRNMATNMVCCSILSPCLSWPLSNIGHIQSTHLEKNSSLGFQHITFFGFISYSLASFFFSVILSVPPHLHSL